MNEKRPVVSLIIGIREHSAGLERVLKMLLTQSYPHQLMEIVLATTNPAAEIEQLLQPWLELLPGRLLVRTGHNLTAARNAAAAAALGQILLFLDEAIEPTADLVQAHVQRQQTQPGCVVIGSCRFATQGPLDFATMKLRSWWEDQFYALAQASHRFTYQDLRGDNFSLAASLFARIGGFDPIFKYGANQELGLRLLKANVLFVFAPEALAYYHRRLDPDYSFQWAYQEGRLEAQFSRQHPELPKTPVVDHCGAPNLPQHWYTPRLLHLLGFTWPAVGNWLAGVCGGLLPLLEQFRLRTWWRKIYCGLTMYWYWRGLAQELGSKQGLARFRQGRQSQQSASTRPSVPPGQGDGLSTISQPEIRLDLSQGLATAEGLLDQARPAGAAIYYGQDYLGDMPAQPGAEQLRGVHLRPFLAQRLAVPLLEALASAQILGKQPETSPAALLPGHEDALITPNYDSILPEDTYDS